MKKNDKITKLITNAVHDSSTIEDELALFTEVYLLAYKMAYNCIMGKFRNLPIETEDMFSTIYLVYMDTIRWFRLTNENVNRFLIYFSHKIRFAVLNECRKYIHQGHVILNYCDNPDDYPWQIEASYNTQFEETDIAKSLTLWLRIEPLSENQKKLCLLKIQGYTKFEIAKILNVQSHIIEYEWIKVKKKLT